MPKREKKPAPIVRKAGAGLEPVSAFAAEELDAYPVGTEFDLVARSKRSNPHHALYWAALTSVNRATEMFATPDHMHTSLKWACGYVTPVWNPDTGEIVEMVDSIGFDAMTQAEFAEYFDKAMAKLAEWTGVDPLCQT